MSRKCLVVGAIALVALVIGAAGLSGGGTPQPAPADEPDFKGKVVAVTAKEPVKGTYLENVRVRRLGGRAFLVGSYAKQADAEKVPEMTYWIPVEDILAITEFNSLEDARKAYTLQKEADK
jgi:hypothetical protein